MILDNIGRPAESFNFAFGDGATIGTFDGEILVALKEGKHGPTPEYIAELRQRLRQSVSRSAVLFPAGRHRDPGLELRPARADRYSGRGYDPKNYDVAREIREDIASLPGVVDAHVHQVMDGPDLHWTSTGPARPSSV